MIRFFPVSRTKYYCFSRDDCKVSDIYQQMARKSSPYHNFVGKWWQEMIENREQRGGGIGSKLELLRPPQEPNSTHNLFHSKWSKVMTFWFSIMQLERGCKREKFCYTNRWFWFLIVNKKVNSLNCSLKNDICADI